MIYEEIEPGTIRRTTYLEDMTAKIVVLRETQAGYGDFAAIAAAQLASGYMTFAGPDPLPTTAPYDYTPPSSLPAGSALLIKIESGQVFKIEGADLTNTITLADAGTYELLLTPPAPHRGFYVEVTLS